jgi:membrane protein YqaA with SNARE-associated domain
MTALAYLLVCVSSFLVDCIPIFAPPAWMVMLLIMIKFELNPWIVVTVGTAGTVSGRMFYTTYIVPWVGRRALGNSKQEDLEFVGRKLSGQFWPVFLFVFVYALLPLSTTALFTVAGLAKVKKTFVIPPFFLGNLIGDGFLLVSGRYVINNIGDLYKGSLEPKNLLLMAIGLAVMLVVLFLDWRELLENKQLHFKLAFWR